MKARLSWCVLLCLAPVSPAAAYFIVHGRGGSCTAPFLGVCWGETLLGTAALVVVAFLVRLGISKLRP